jgi:hypothetical protein
VAGKARANRGAQSCFWVIQARFPANPTATRRSHSCGEVCDVVEETTFWRRARYRIGEAAGR